jgi:NADH dehydrogenase [ubiquinone] 1 alpha subcomplex assembly factor 6
MNKEQLLSVCSDVVYRHDRERMMCLSLAPLEKREPLLTLLAFNYEVSIIPELVSETLLGEMRLQWWRDTIVAIYAGIEPNHPVALGLAWAIKKCELSKNLFEEYLAVRSFDLLKTPPATLAELENYARGTAGALHELMAEVLLVKPNLKIRFAARNAGTAWALSGLIMAIPFHASQGRSYLPADLSEDVRVVAVAEAAERYVQEARRAHLHVPNSLMPVMLPIALVENTLRKLARYNFDTGDARVQRLGIGRLFGFYWKVIRKRY